MEGGFERPSLVGDPEGILITLFLGFVPPGEVLLGDETEGILETCGLSVGLCRGETLGDLDFLTVEAFLTPGGDGIFDAFFSDTLFSARGVACLNMAGPSSFSNHASTERCSCDAMLKRGSKPV